jgi:putative oxidoreductase
MLERLLRTESDVGPLVLRVVLGVVMMPHGLQHWLGWFGGPGSRARCGTSARSWVCPRSWSSS